MKTSQVCWCSINLIVVVSLQHLLLQFQEPLKRERQKIIKTHRASFITQTTWNYREGKALRFQGDETKTSLHLTYQEISEADLIIFVKDRGMFDDTDSFEDDGEILGMAVVSLKEKIKISLLIVSFLTMD